MHHLYHVVHLRGMAAGDEGGAAIDQGAHWIDRLIKGAPRIGLGFEADGRGGGGLFLGQTINRIVHDDIRHARIFPRRVDEVITADGEAIAVTAEHKNVQIIASEANPSGKRQGAAVNIVTAVRVDEVGEAGGATDAGERDDFFLRVIKFLENFIKGSEHGKIAAAGAPRGVVGDEDFFSEGSARSLRR